MLPFAFQVIKFNHAQAPTRDVNFRLAVQAALDMEEIMAISYADSTRSIRPGFIRKPPSTAMPGTSKFNKADLPRPRRSSQNRATRARS